MACETSNARIQEASLEGLHKLITYGYLKGQGPPSCPRTEESKTEVGDPNGSWKLIDEVTESACLCKRSDDDNVQLQLLKVLLAVVTTPHCEV